MSEIPCTRRAVSYWSKCNCPSCRADRARKRARHYGGLPWRYPQEVAWPVLASKIDAGWTSRALGSATGLGPDYFDRHVAQHRKGRVVQLGPAVAAAVMNMGVPREGQVGAEPSRRRLRALACIGHGLNSLVIETEVGFSTLAAIRSDSAERVGAQRALIIAETYDRLCMIVGDDEQAVRVAREKGWSSPLAWDDIDDLTEQPTAVRIRTRRPTAELLAEWAFLERAGESIEQAAIALGVTVSAIEKACERNRKAAAA